MTSKYLARPCIVRISFNIVLTLVVGGPSWYGVETGRTFFFPLTTWPRDYGDGTQRIKGMPLPASRYMAKAEIKEYAKQTRGSIAGKVRIYCEAFEDFH